MPFVSIFFGLLLLIYGIVLRISFDSGTVLIPSYVGVILILLGAAANTKPAWRKHLMHAAAGLALLGAALSLPGFIGFIQILSGEEIKRPVAAYAQSGMFVLLVPYILLAIRSFIDARQKPPA